MIIKEIWDMELIEALEKLTIEIERNKAPIKDMDSMKETHYKLKRELLLRMRGRN